MSYERPDPERGPYTPRNDDDLPFDRSGFDARGHGGGRPPLPLTLLISAGVLLILIVVVVLFYRAGVRDPGATPPVIEGSEGMATTAPDAARAEGEAAQIEVFDPLDEQLQAAPPPEAPSQRPPPLTNDTAAVAPTTPPRAEGATPAEQRPTPPPQRPPVQPPAPTGGRAAVQIGAFSTEQAAERAYADVAAAFPQFATGRTRGIRRVTTSDGRTVYRTTVNGLSADEARAFCGAMRASGRDCLVQ
ncbi:MAG: SPOR domain-containing protein [Caulobacterales bacterium]|nr:SPOR domain-containing protein [Caulobacterales bacterium]